MRALVNVSTGGHYLIGQRRLEAAMAQHDPSTKLILWQDMMPEGAPSHYTHPYAFKAYALMEAAQLATTLLWCDAAVLPIGPLDALWERVEKDGYWLHTSGDWNYNWMADATYDTLFPNMPLDEAREVNKGIEHISASAFALDVSHPVGKELLHYFYDHTKGDAFCGPWVNSNCYPNVPVDDIICYPCGPSDVNGHRHDQTVLSVLAWRMGLILDRSDTVQKTMLLTDGSYESRCKVPCATCKSDRSTVHHLDGYYVCNKCGRQWT